MLNSKLVLWFYKGLFHYLMHDKASSGWHLYMTRDSRFNVTEAWWLSQIEARWLSN